MGNLYPTPHIDPISTVRDGTLHTLSTPVNPSGYSYRLLVNGQPVPWSPYGKPLLVTVEGVPSVELERSVDIIVTYSSLVDGMPDVTPAAYDAEHCRLLGKSTVDKEGMRWWKRLEDEVQWQRFERGYTSMTRKEWFKVTDLELLVVDKVPEMPFITPSRMLGGDYMKTTAIYDRPGFMVATLKEALAREGLTEGKGRNSYNLFYHSHEISLHLPGGFHRKQPVHAVGDQYVTVLAKRDQDKELVEGWVREWMRCFHSPVNAAEVIADIRGVRDDLVRLKVYAGNIGERGGLVHRLDALMTKLDTQALGEKK